MTLFWLILFLICPPWAEGAEFAAKMVVREKDRLMPGKIYIKDNKMRQEFLDDKGHTITIVRGDKRLVWVVLPWERTYVELPLGPRLPGQFLQIPPEAVSRRARGTEMMGGYEVERVEVTSPGGSRQTFWVAPKLGLPIKTVAPERQYSVEYQNIQEKKLEDRLFEIPRGYQKVGSVTRP
ncbi:MAG: hypothetical protein ACUVXF_10240 [Desulfobaccales bacterium]